jgi:hypothetical protein
MYLFSIVLIIAGLVLFETITSIDNAIINAEVLSTMSERAKRWFLTWGLLIAVFAIRGLLPWIMVWLSTQSLGPVEAFTATFSSNPLVLEAIEQSAPILLTGGGTFLIFLFLHWLFLEGKNYGLRGERYIATKGVWFLQLSLFCSGLSGLRWTKNRLWPLGQLSARRPFYRPRFPAEC